jgi:uncharacterized protein with HEPN domain
MSETLRLKKIFKALEDIELIIDSEALKISQAIDDAVIKPALRMQIVKIAEQFNKLKDENSFKTLEAFNTKDLRGLSAVRNFIAHDYDSVDDDIIESVIRENLPNSLTMRIYE